LAKSVGSSLLVAALPWAEFRLRIGVGTYSYHNLSIDQMIEQLKLLRVAEIEMSRGEFMLFSQPESGLFQATKEKLDRAGIRCISYYAATLKNADDVERVLKFAKLLSANNVSGDAVGEVLAAIDHRFAEEGLSFGIHNHYFKGQRFPYESPDDVKKALAQLSPTVGATADVGQFVSCGYDPVEALRTLGPRLKLVHLKDIQAKGDEVNVLLGTGVARISNVMQELRRQRFGGLVAVEYEKEGPVEDDMRKEIEFARGLA